MCFAVGLLCRAQYMYLGNAVGNCYIALFRVVNIVWSAGNEAWTSLWTVIWQRTDDCLVTRAIDGPSRPLLSVSDKELNVQSYLCQVSLPRNKQTKTSDYPGVKYRL